MGSEHFQRRSESKPVILGSPIYGHSVLPEMVGFLEAWATDLAKRIVGAFVVCGDDLWIPEADEGGSRNLEKLISLLPKEPAVTAVFSGRMIMDDLNEEDRVRILAFYRIWGQSTFKGAGKGDGVKAPVVNSVEPDSGSTSGGETVTVNGRNFVATPSVTFGTVYSPSVTFVTNKILSVMTPAHGAGTVDLTVINPDLQSDTLPGGFTFISSGPPPVITSVDPDNGDIKAATR